MGRFLKDFGKLDKTKAGKIMIASGKAVSYSSQQRLALRPSIIRLAEEVDTFYFRAIDDTSQTVSSMEKVHCIGTIIRYVHCPSEHIQKINKIHLPILGIFFLDFFLFPRKIIWKESLYFFVDFCPENIRIAKKTFKKSKVFLYNIEKI